MASVQLKNGFGCDADGNLLPGDAGREATTLIFVNGPNSGDIGGVYGYFYCDLGKAKLRVAFRGPAGWRVSYLTVDSEVGAYAYHPSQGDSHMSVTRVPLDANDTTSHNVPVGYGTNVFAK